jgi:integrase
MGKYHLFQVENKSKKVWYYWYWDGEKQVKKSTRRNKLRGPDGAEEFIEALEREDRVLAAHPVKRPHFKDVASPMFLPGAAHLQRREAHDQPLKEHTRKQHKRNVDRLIRWFGDDYLDEVTEDRVEDKLAGIIEPSKEKLESEEERTERLAIKAKSSSWKNSHLYSLKLIFREAKRSRFVQSMPAFDPFRRHFQKQSTLSDEELDRLFPLCPGALECLWRMWNSKTMIADPPGTGLMFGAMFALMVSAGLRSGEGRAFHLDQLIPARKCVLVNRAFDNDGVLGFPKEGKEDNPRIRVAPIPDKTIQILNWWLAFRGRQEGYLFQYRGHPMLAGKFLGTRWSYGLIAAGINTEDRKLTPHCLRYTYNTRMKRRLPPDVLRSITGHMSESMSELYDNPAIAQLINDLSPYQSVINGFWGETTCEKDSGKLIGEPQNLGTLN